MWSLEKQGTQICEDAVGIWVSTSMLKSRTKPSVDKECLGAKSLLETTMLKVVTPERGTAPVLRCTSKPKMVHALTSFFQPVYRTPINKPAFPFRATTEQQTKAALL